MPASPDQRIAGLRTTIYHVPDLARAKQWYADLFQRTPYFDEPFYVGFNVGGYELGLHPAEEGHPVGAGGCVAYWGVSDLTAMVTRLRDGGISIHAEPQDVGGGIKVATVRDPFGNIIGLIENPHFTLTDANE